MSFSSTQIRKLQQGLKPDCIRSREVNGRQMSYIEGWHAIAEANRIFGFDAWNRETVESRCVLSRESKGSFHTIYIAKVRITVRTSETTIVREGYGSGDAQASSAGEAHDKAIKTAETDATKRALATFGNPFGLSLYLGSRLRDKPAAPIGRRRTLQRLGANGRYHVVARKVPVLDPALAPANGKALEPEVEGSVPPNRVHFAEIMSAEIKSAGVTPSQVKSAKNETADTALSEVRSAQVMAVEVISSDPLQCLNSNEALPPAEPSPDPMLIARSKRQRDASHLRFVANQPCLVCSRTPSDAHHLKFAQPHALSRKVSDEFTVPLCRIHHRQLHHGGNEVNWWIDMDIDPLPIARHLWDESQRSQPTPEMSKAHGQ